MKARTAIIIVNYRTAWHLGLCLESVFKHSQDFHVYLVHNAPDDESLRVGDEFVARYSDYITVLVNKENLGFVGGVNTAYELAMEHERLCFLNSDIIVTNGWLAALNQTLDHDASIAQVAADTNSHYPENLLWRIVQRLPGGLNKLFRLRYYLQPPRYQGPQRGFHENPFYLFAGGYCNLTRAEYFRDLGYFLDPNIAHGYWDDLDLSCYLNQFGKTGTSVEAYVFHFLNASFNRLSTKRDQLKQQLQLLNGLYVMHKWEKYFVEHMQQLDHEELLSISANSNLEMFFKYAAIKSLKSNFDEYLKTNPANKVWAQLTSI